MRTTGVGVSLWLGWVGIHLSTEEGLQVEIDRRCGVGILACVRQELRWDPVD